MAASPRGPRSIAQSVRKVVSPALRRRGFAASEILARWPAIVGNLVAEHSCPEKLAFPAAQTEGAVLRVRVASGFAPELQHLAPLIVERINTFYGYRAVERLKLTQGPLPKRPAPAAKPRPLTNAEKQRLDKLVEPVTDQNLRQALWALGQSVLTAAR